MKKFRNLGPCILAIPSLMLAIPVAQATSITVNLGQSAQNYTLTGQGEVNSHGTYLNTQGACSVGASTTSCLLSGAYTGSTTGFTDGSYQFITTYTNGEPPQSVSEDPVGGPNQNYFNYSYLSPGTTMYLDLAQNGGPTYDIPLFTNGSFDANFSFTDVSYVCGGTSLGTNPCSQIDVGLVNGATLSGPVTMSATFDSSTASTVTPEPAPAILLGSGLLALGCCVVVRRQRATSGYGPNQTLC